jgi:MFS family permease
MRYRWAVLAAGTTAQASFSALTIGLPVLVPALQDKYDLSLREIGLLLASQWIGALVTLLPWGVAADRFGERIVLAVGLVGCGAALVAAAFASGFAALFAWLALAGASGSSVNSASGRAVMRWFDVDERGLALGVRQTAIPVGGLVAALTLPLLVHANGVEAAFLFLALLCVVGAIAGAVVLRERDLGDEVAIATVGRTLRDARLLRLSLGSGLYLYSQVAVIGFGVLLLHDVHGLSDRDAALVIAASQVLAIGLRIGVGRWSDVVGARIGPLRRVGLAVSAALLATAALADGPLAVLVPALAIAGGLSMAWNGLAFTAAAELAGAGRSGSAIGFQQTVLSAVGVVGPVVFAATLSTFSWTAALAFAAAVPLIGSLTLGPLRGY